MLGCLFERFSLITIIIHYIFQPIPISSVRVTWQDTGVDLGDLTVN